MNLESRRIGRLDHLGRALLCAAGLLTTIGLIMVYAASSMKGLQQFSDPFLFLRKQALVAMTGVGIVFILGKLSEDHLRKIVIPLLAVALCLLALIFVPGVYKSGGGAARWISLFGLRFQTSEIAKIALVFFLAKNLSRTDFDIHSFKHGVLPNVCVFGVFALLMMKQPDFGSTVLLGVILVTMLFVAGLSWRYIVGCMAGALLSMAVAVAVAPYRLARLTSFLDPWGEIQRGGFQIIQSYLAFQNGGFVGVGLGESRQKLFFLPEAHTDFILAVLGEELGFLGVLLVVCLFSFYCIVGIEIALLQSSTYRRYLAFGLTSIIGFQATINMAVAMGMLPTKGIPLPFISSGASSLLISILVTGFLWRLSRYDTSQDDKFQARRA